MRVSLKRRQKKRPMVATIGLCIPVKQGLLEVDYQQIFRYLNITHITLGAY